MARRGTTRPEATAPTGRALAYTNRKDVTYYLHEARTKSGEVRYVFARSVGEGALAELPDGYEVSESLNGVVSARRRKLRKATIADEELALVRAAMARHEHLSHHVATTERGAIVIHQPDTDVADMRRTAQSLGLSPRRAEAFVADSLRRSRFSPVLRFVPEGSRWVAHRMTYRGYGGWSRPLASGALDELARRLVGAVGTDAFFELM